MTLTGDDSLTAGSDPGGRAVAPGALRLVQAMVNTRNALTLDDLWETPRSTQQWLSQAVPELADAVLTHGQWRQVVQVRELLRTVLLGHRDGFGAPADVTQQLDACLSGGCLKPRIGPDGVFELVPTGEAFEKFCGWLAMEAVQAQHDGTWPRLKACPGDHCGWAYFDRSPSNASRWCSMSVCGGRAKARASRQRRRAESR